MEIVASAVFGEIANRVAAQTPPEVSLTLPAAEPDELAMARFAATMRTAKISSPEATQSSVVNAIEASAQTHVVSEAPSLGDRMLASLEAASGSFKSSWSSLENKLNSHQISGMQEMLKMQLQVSQMAVHYDLLGKIVSRSTQNVDQLVRVQ